MMRPTHDRFFCLTALLVLPPPVLVLGHHSPLHLPSNRPSARNGQTASLQEPP